ncbi:MAG: AMP-binding protein [Ignavibacteriales bacterium]|nr:AMP-binding protein [Ignavibacteriales bacterium]
MLSQYGGGTDQQYFTLQHMIEESCQKNSSNIALSYTDEEPIRYSDLKRQIDHLSGFLRNQGVTQGDRVAILGENSPQWGIAYFAITTMGAVVVPILPDFNTSEIHHILGHSGSKVIFISERYFYKIEDLDFTEFNSVILLNDFSIINPEMSKATLRQLISDGSKELRKIKNLVLGLAGFIQKEIKEDDIASIIYTSGTTGNSKGVMLTHKNIVWNAFAASKIPDFTADDRMLSVLPLAHVYECTLGLVLPIMCGSSVYYIKKPPTAAVLLPALEMVKPTAMLTVPLIIEKMYKTRIVPEIKRRLLVRLVYKFPVVRKHIHKIAGNKLKETFGGAMRFFGVGGAALAPEVERFLRDAEFPYAIGYGLTETSPLIAGANAENTRYRSTGPIVPGLEVRIENQDSKTGIGEIAVRGPSIMKGYYRDPGLTAEVVSPDGWFHTGDLGSFDKNGFLYINGRLKNIILGPSGENIYPEVIESVINRLDIILESLVYQDEGQLVARVYLDYEKLDVEFSDIGLTESQARERIKQLCEDIKKQVNEQVSSFSRLARVIEQTAPFEKTPTQKIKRYLYAT